jgi:two-component system CheB/CheR fusion protein
MIKPIKEMVIRSPKMPKKKTTDTKLIKVESKASDSAIKQNNFPVIGIGASAGGLEALNRFFSKVSDDSGMAYIVVVHMAPTQPSILPELLQSVTSIPVSAARDDQFIEPNRVYISIPNKEITIYNGKIQLLDIVKNKITHPIDLFFKSLGQDKGKHAASIILSGTGTDGTLGIKEIKINDGLVLVQSEESADYDGMPRSAIKTGLVDMVLPPEEMPSKLIDYFSHPQIKTDKATTTTTTTTELQQKWLNKIFAILRTQIGHDFSLYKTNTILRRIARRMGLHRIDKHEIYVRYLRENPNEIDALFRELLIGVTNFFRDAESFDILKSAVIPELFDQIENGSTFRAWIPGCSTGEEVYSIAIVLRECLENVSKQIDIQLFGTDIDKFAIDSAREGLFPASIASEVSKDRLKRYFTKEDDYYRIRKEIRDTAVFSVQDVMKDPPFSRLNLLCCRNLLIYLNSEAQKRLLPLFHYTLSPNGILVLGSSETIGGFSSLFKIVDKKWKIFKRQEVPNSLRQIVNFPSGTFTGEQTEINLPITPVTQGVDLVQVTQNAILNRFSPTGILTDGKGEILHIQGRTGKYLEKPSGPPTNNIVDSAREGLRIELSSALRTAKLSGKMETRKRVSVKTNGDVQLIDLHVCPPQTHSELGGNFLIVFEDIDNNLIPLNSKQEMKEISLIETPRIAELEKELQITRESHQTTIEELESSNEELKSTNEEMQSSNEELQSTNEEMESSKEELQSLNEELQTVNSELQSKVEELSAAHNDMNNLLNSTEIATIFVDSKLCIRRFTSKATAIINLIQTDIGRPLKHVVSNLAYDKMISDCHDVLENLIPKEDEVKTVEGKWYNMRLMPYRTTDNRIDGVVLTFSSIEDQKMTQEYMTKSIDFTRSIFDMNDEPMAVLDQDGNFVMANIALTSILGVSQENINGMNIYSTLKIKDDASELKLKLDNALEKSEDFIIENFAFKDKTDGSKYTIKARIKDSETIFPYKILLRFIEQQ